MKREPMRIDEQQVGLLAALAGIEIAPEHLPGVIRNLGALQAQAALLLDRLLDPSVEPAPVFRP